MAKRKDRPFYVGQVIGYSRVEVVLRIEDRCNRTLYRVRTICCGAETTRLHDSLQKAARRGAIACQHCATLLLKERAAQAAVRPQAVRAGGWVWQTLGAMGFRGTSGTFGADARG